MERRTEYVTGNEPREVSFIVDGQPIPKARAKVTWKPGRRPYGYTPRTTREWQGLVSLSAKLAMALAGHRSLFLGSVELVLWIYSKDGRRRDSDNIEKGISDAMNGIVYVDDSQVADCHRYRRLDRERPRVEVRVREITI